MARTNHPKLPHFDHPFAIQHVVFRLADALPAGLAGDLKRRSPADRMGAADAVLDAGLGSRALAEPEAARVVAEALNHFDGQRYQLWAWCVMPTHVHVLAGQTEGWSLPSVIHTWKSFTAKKINRSLDREGRFWAANYFDRFIRDDDQFNRTLGYIEDNPVKAGLCGLASEWRWSSAAGR